MVLLAVVFAVNDPAAVAVRRRPIILEFESGPTAAMYISTLHWFLGLDQLVEQVLSKIIPAPLVGGILLLLYTVKRCELNLCA